MQSIEKFETEKPKSYYLISLKYDPATISSEAKAIDDGDKAKFEGLCEGLEITKQKHWEIQKLWSLPASERSKICSNYVKDY